MKKFYVICILINVLSLCSCVESRTDIIQKEFELYVDSNFDDPSNLMEIINIELNDTINNEDIDSLMVLTNKLDSLISDDTIQEETLKEFDKLKTKFSPDDLDYSDRERLLDLFSESIKIGRKKILSLGYKKNKIVLDSIYNTLDSFNLYQYKIQVRIKENNQPKIKYYYAIEEDSNIRFYNDMPNLEEMSDKLQDFSKAYNEYSEKQKLSSDLHARQIVINTEIMEIIATYILFK